MDPQQVSSSSFKGCSINQKERVDPHGRIVKPGAADHQGALKTSMASNKVQANLTFEQGVLAFNKPEEQGSEEEASYSGQGDEGSEPETYLHKLPAELRNVIYRYVGLVNRRVYISSTEEPALIQAIPSLREELYFIMFGENKFEVVVYSNFSVDDNGDNGRPIRQPVPSSRCAVGRLSIRDDSWISKSEHAIRFRHIGFRVAGTEPLTSIFCMFINVPGKGTNSGPPHVKTMHFSPGALRPYFLSKIEAAKSKAKAFSAQLGFCGFTVAELDDIAKCFVWTKAERRAFKPYTVNYIDE